MFQEVREDMVIQVVLELLDQPLIRDLRDTLDQPEEQALLVLQVLLDSLELQDAMEH